MNTNSATYFWQKYTTFSCSFYPRGVLGIWADTYARFRVWPTHPSIYQNFLLKPIYLPKFSAQNPSIYQNYPSKHQFLFSNLSIYQNLVLRILPSTKILRFRCSKPIHLPKFNDFFRKWPTHLSTLAFQNPSFYIDHTYPWKYVSTPTPPISDKLLIKSLVVYLF